MAKVKGKDAPKQMEWKRSNPGVKRKEEFRSNAAKYAVTHHHDSISKSLFTLDIVCRARAKSDSTSSFDFDEAIGAVEKELNELENDIAAKNEQIRTLLHERKISDLVEYESPWSREFTIKTPQALTALKIFKDFDTLNIYLDTAYLFGLTEKPTVDEISNKMATQFKELARSLHVRSDNALRQLRQSHEANVASGNGKSSDSDALAELTDLDSPRVDDADSKEVASISEAAMLSGELEHAS